MPVTATIRLFMIGFPALVMIVLIPYIRDDFVLAGVYIFIIAISAMRYTRHDFLFLAIGFVVLFLSELLFISTGVESFERRSLFGVMPVWLPLLWAYVFVVIKRSVVIVEKYIP